MMILVMAATSASGGSVMERWLCIAVSRFCERARIYGNFSAMSFIKGMQITNPNEEHKYKVRKLQITDKTKGFLELLQQLTVCDRISDEEFQGRFLELCAHGDDHVIYVIEDDDSGKIIATGTLFIEKKFIRSCGKAGHIEDVVVDSGSRGMHLGKKIIGFLTEHARSMGCYKVTLDCKEENREFYEKCGLEQRGVQMVKYFV